MIVLDENFGLGQRERLRSWRIRFRHVGTDLLRQGADDAQIIPLLHRLSRPTFFTWDRQFYDRDLRHHGYCLVHVDVARSDLAAFTRRSCATRPSAPAPSASERSCTSATRAYGCGT